VSLINQMLQDLEQRRSAAGPQAAVFQGLSGGTATGSARGRVTLVMGGAILGLTVALALSLYGRGQPAPPMRVAGAAPQPVTPIAAATPPPASVQVAKDVPNRAEPKSIEQPAQPLLVAAAREAALAEAVDTEPAPAITQPAPKASPAPTEADKESQEPKSMPPHTAPPRTDEVMVAMAPAHKAAPVVVVKKKPRPLTAAERAEQAYGAAVAHLQDGQQSLGEAALREALTRDPRHVKARELLAGLLIRAARTGEAAQLLRQGLAFHPRHTPFAKLYARILVEQGDVAGAVKVLDGASPDVALEPDYHAFRAALYQRMKQHPRAVAIYRQVVKARPDAGVWWMGLAISLEAQGDNSDALQAFRRAAVSGGLNPELQKYVQSRMVALNANR